MDASVYFALKLVHLLAMAVWVGGPPIAVFGLRRRMDAGSESALAEIERLLAVTPVFIVAALTTVAAGIGLIWAAGGVASVPPRVLVGAALVVPIFALGGAVTRPALVGLRAHFSSGGDVRGAERMLRKFVLGHRLEIGFRVAALALMVVKA